MLFYIDDLPVLFPCVFTELFTPDDADFPLLVGIRQYILSNMHVRDKQLDRT